MEPTKPSPILHLSPIVLAAALAFGGLGYYLGNMHGQTAATNTNLSTYNPPVVSRTTITTRKTLANTKFDFSFKYPSNNTVSGITGSDGQSADPAVAEVDNVFPKGVMTSPENAIFSVAVFNYEVTAASIKEHLGTSTSVITPITVAGKNGFKYVNPGDGETLYFLTNASNTSLEITVKDNNADAKNMFDSFELTK